MLCYWERNFNNNKKLKKIHLLQKKISKLGKLNLTLEEPNSFLTKFGSLRAEIKKKKRKEFGTSRTEFSVLH